MIRRMTAADLEQVAELEQVCFSDPWSYRQLEEGLPAVYDAYFVAVQEEQVQGYGVLRVLAGEGEIQRIAVLPACRKLGTGRELMAAMATYARAKETFSLSLEVRDSNLAARNLYESYGFRATAIRKDYYRNPVEDAIIMWRHED